MLESMRTSDSGVAVLTRTGTGTVLEMEHDASGALIATIRCTQYRDGVLTANLYTAEVEDHAIALNLQEALYSGRPVEFRIEWWDTDGSNDLGMGSTVITRATVDTTQPSRPRRVAAI